MLGLLSCALNRVIIELCQEKSSNHEKHGWNFYAKVVFLQPLYYPKYCISTDFNHNMMCILADKNIFAGLPSSPAFLN